MCPVYFKPSSIANLSDVIAEIASGAPDLPFWYYHFPAKTGVDMNMYELVKHIDETQSTPNFMGIKFTNEILMDFNAMGNYKNKKYNMLLGRDEIFTSGLVTGVCDGGVGSTINFMSFNCDIQAEWDKGADKDMDKITALQL
jgi:N-acetylneuraminate lyase